MIFSAVKIRKEYENKYDNYGNITSSVFKGFELSQEVQIESNEVDKIENISRQVSELINLGVEFYSNEPEYYYTKLSQLKIEMIAEATKDASIRAKKNCRECRGRCGKIKKCQNGNISNHCSKFFRGLFIGRFIQYFL